MSTKFQSKFAQVMIFGIFGVLIASFALTGFQSNVSFISDGAPSVAKVDGNLVTVKEYRNALRQQVEFYSKMMGGKSLTTKQIDQFGIKQTVLKRLVERKLVENVASENGFASSGKELIAEIKKLPYFQSNGKFDLNRYKQLLAANRFTPQGFEATTAKDLKVQKFEKLLNDLNISSNKFSADLTRFKATSTSVNVVEFSKESLRSKIAVSSSEINKYLKDVKKTKELQTKFDSIKYKYNKPAQVKAKHILLKIADESPATQAATLAKANKIRKTLTVANFAKVAKKESQGPSSKAGGDLGWFSKDKMVKEFSDVAFSLKKGKISKPVKTKFGYHIILNEGNKRAVVKTFNSVKKDLAKEEVRKNKDKDLDQLFDKTIAKINGFLSSNNTKAIQRMVKSHGLSFEEKKKANIVEKSAGKVNFSTDDYKKISLTSNVGKVLNIGTAQKARLVKVLAFNKAQADDKAVESTRNAQETTFRNQLRQNLLSDVEANSTIKTYPALL
jgi:peptidyl-prolyl cis-trans isomerase D